MINISKERLDKIILEETAFLLQETNWTDEQLLDIFQTLESNRQKTEEWKGKVNKFINIMLKNVSKLEDEVSTMKQQIPGLESTEVAQDIGVPIVPIKDETKTIDFKSIAENKNNHGGELVSTEY